MRKCVELMKGERRRKVCSIIEVERKIEDNRKWQVRERERERNEGEGVRESLEG